MSEDLTRRGFVGSAGAALAMGPAVLPALGANDKINVGFIGAGGRGYYLMERLYKGSAPLVTVTAVCDAYSGRLARGKDRVQTMGGNVPATYKDYRQLLADKSIDVVVIATPEHLHHDMAIAAIKAGKNIYLEKPLAHTIEEGEDLLKAARASKSVIQVGTQNRSNSLYIKAKEMISQGLIGEIHYVRAFWYRNSLTDSPAWRYEIPADASEENTDWKGFLGPAAKRAFDKQRFYQWRLYWDYSGGISTDLLVHQTDITNFVCGKTVPGSCMASGGIYRWTGDDRDVPDTFSALYEYPDSKFHINYSCYFGNEHFGYGEQFCGNEGTIEVNSRQHLFFWPETFRGKAPAHIAARKDQEIHLLLNDNLAVEAHMRNLLEAIQGKAKLVAPPEVGQQAAVGGHMATLSYRNNKKIYWDDNTRKYRF
ncbi:MAG: Gfo/Idh/MocA family oxidoreductase, partial [Acidobacteria bacterium]|nr:Gfo/Idh/MocA family oxidoreductase [Acidobacteriota bacterium]